MPIQMTWISIGFDNTNWINVDRHWSALANWSSILVINVGSLDLSQFSLTLESEFDQSLNLISTLLLNRRKADLDVDLKWSFF